MKSLRGAKPGVPKLQLTAAAIADLDDIDAYGAAHFGEDAADSYAAALRHALDLLEGFPRSAPSRDDFGPGIRCRSFRSHLILHVVENETVLVVRILHHTQDVKRALKP
jgi:toxin ParE1/3/4